MTTETRSSAHFHDIMVEGPRPNPFDRPESVLAFAANCAALGVGGVAQRSAALLARAAELEREALAAKESAFVGYIAARNRLERGDLDVAGFGTEVAQYAVWLEHDAEQGRASIGMGAVMHVARQLRQNSVQVFMGETSGIYARLAALAAEQIRAMGALPAPPRSLWSAADPAAEASRIGWGHPWIDADAAARRFSECHRLGDMLLRTPDMVALAFWPGGCPSWASVYRRWDLAADLGLDAIRRLALPLRLRKAIDDGWGPGLWTAHELSADPKADAAKAPKKFFAAWR